GPSSSLRGHETRCHPRILERHRAQPLLCAARCRPPRGAFTLAPGGADALVCAGPPWSGSSKTLKTKADEGVGRRPGGSAPPSELIPLISGTGNLGSARLFLTHGA